MPRASSPERRTTPRPDRPGGVEMATMVSRGCRTLRPAAAATASAEWRTASPSSRRTIAARRRAGARRTNRFRQRHADRQHHHLAKWTGASALAADLGLLAETQMNDAPLTAVHRIEVEWPARLLHLLGGGHGAQPQLLDAHHAVIVRVEAQSRMMLGRHVE